VHDNVTAGGFETARVDMDNVTSSSILTAAGITATTAELNYVDGVTSNIQTQLDGKAGTASPTFTGTLTTANLTATGTTTLAGASTSADITFGDNDKAIFGAGSDLSIYHDGANSYITEGGVGDLRLGAANIRIGDNTSGASYIYATQNAEVTLYHNNSPKLATTSTGVDITGTLTSDGLTVDATESYINGRLRLESGANSQDLRFSDTSTTDQNAQLRLSSGSLLVQSQNNSFNAATTRASFANNGDISFYEDTGTTPKFFWDASAESLGIGTSSPARPLQVAMDNAGATVASLKNSGATSAMLGFQGSGSTNDSNVRIGVSDDTDFTVTTNNAEAMRIDSSGNLLVGTTSLGNADVGVEARANGTLTTTADSQTALFVKRIGSGSNDDGELARFQNADGTVGSIGTYQGDMWIGTGDTTLFFHDGIDAILPSGTSGAGSDGQKSLGYSNSRFKDLYLSGGVYLGGTGSANKLDDYEEGTWTPTATANITINSIENATYTKVGRKVTLSAWMKVDITNVDFIFAGFPFSVSGRTCASVTNPSTDESIANQCLSTSCYGYGADTTGTNDDFFFSLTYDT
jgi:hypothetical protein